MLRAEFDQRLRMIQGYPAKAWYNRNARDEMATRASTTGHAVAKTAAKPGKVEQTHSVVVGKEVDRICSLAQGEPIQQCVGQLATVISNTGGWAQGSQSSWSNSA